QVRRQKMSDAALRLEVRSHPAHTDVAADGTSVVELLTELHHEVQRLRLLGRVVHLTRQVWAARRDVLAAARIVETLPVARVVAAPLVANAVRESGELVVVVDDVVPIEGHENRHSDIPAHEVIERENLRLRGGRRTTVYRIVEPHRSALAPDLAQCAPVVGGEAGNLITLREARARAETVDPPAFRQLEVDVEACGILLAFAVFHVVHRCAPEAVVRIREAAMRIVEV